MSKTSPYFNVSKRRKSRQSNNAFSNIDFEYIGNAGQFAHLLKMRKDQGTPTKEQLSFEMNLRNYQADDDSF